MKGSMPLSSQVIFFDVGFSHGLRPKQAVQMLEGSAGAGVGIRNKLLETSPLANSIGRFSSPL
jgi:hypothetical protein